MSVLYPYLKSSIFKIAIGVGVGLNGGAVSLMRACTTAEDGLDPTMDGLARRKMSGGGWLNASMVVLLHGRDALPSDGRFGKGG